MDELGHILREARETKGLTLQEVQQSTRITSRYLDALENGDYDRLPSPVHTRGFLRNYARFLGLDPQPLLDRYESNQGRQPRKKTQPTLPPELVGQPLKEPPADHHFFEPVNMSIDAGYGRVPTNNGNRSETVMRVVIIAALVCLIYMTVQFFIPRLTGEGDRSAEVTEGIQNAVQNLFNQEETPEETIVPEEQLDLAPSSILTSTSRNNFAPVETSTTPIPTRPILPTMEQIELDIVITERAWMQVTIDGDIVFSGNARPGDTYEWTAQSTAELNTGNAIGVDISINGINLGPLGSRGQHIQESWSTTR